MIPVTSDDRSRALASSLSLQTQDHGPSFEDMIGKLYRSGGQNIADLVSVFPEERRARLALFCYGRAHMRDIGLAVAATCEVDSLFEVGATAGKALYALSRERVAPVGKPLTGRHKITLANLSDGPAPTPDYDPEPETAIAPSEVQALTETFAVVQSEAAAPSVTMALAEAS
jgi:hypothetical protein